MKKIFLMLFIPLLLSGCYDYNQLNDLGIISGIAIDYDKEEFKVTFEIISTKKEGETSSSSGTYYITSSGNTLVEAFTKSANKIDKVPYFEHVEIVVFSEEVANNFGQYGFGMRHGMGHGMGHGYGMMGNTEPTVTTIAQAEEVVKQAISNLKGYTITSTDELQVMRGTAYKVNVKDSAGNQLYYFVNPYGYARGPLADIAQNK